MRAAQPSVEETKDAGARCGDGGVVGDDEDGRAADEREAESTTSPSDPSDDAKNSASEASNASAASSDVRASSLDPGFVRMPGMNASKHPTTRTNTPMTNPSVRILPRFSVVSADLRRESALGGFEERRHGVWGTRARVMAGL